MGDDFGRLRDWGWTGGPLTVEDADGPPPKQKLVAARPLQEPVVITRMLTGFPVAEEDRLPGIKARLAEADAAEEAGWGAFGGTQRERAALDEIKSRCRTDLKWAVAYIEALRSAKP